MLISKKGREWMKLAVVMAKAESHGWFVNGPCAFSVRVWFPDNRRRDLDNLLKPVQDCITHAGIWKDDCQVHDLRITRMAVDKNNPRCECIVEAL